MSAEQPVTPNGDDAGAPSVTTLVVRNEGGTEDVHLEAGGSDGARLAKAIESGFNDILKTHMRRAEFSGHIHVVVLEMTPRAERRHIPPVIERLRGICSELATSAGRYRVSVTYQTSPVGGVAAPAVAVPAAAAVSLPALNLTARVSDRYSGRMWLLGAVAVLVTLVTGYKWWMSFESFSFPDSIEYGDEHLTRFRTWTMDGISGAVFIHSGEDFSTAPLQLGVMMSAARPTAEDLDAWIRGQYAKTPTQTYYDSGAGDETCKAGLSRDGRAFMAVQVCKTGEGRAACAEDDEPMPASVLAPCMSGSDSCWEDACNRRRRDDRAALEDLAGRFLAGK